MTYQFRSLKCKIHVLFMGLWFVYHSKHSLVIFHECKCTDEFCHNAVLRCQRCQKEKIHACYDDKL